MPSFYETNSNLFARHTTSRAGRAHENARAVAVPRTPLPGEPGPFAEDSDGRFSITAGAQPLQADSADSIMAEVRWNGSEVIRRSWDNLGHSVRTGQTARSAHRGRDGRA